MKRMKLLELFVFAIFSELSVVTPMFSRRGSSSSSAPDPEQPFRCHYWLKMFMRTQSTTGVTAFHDSKIALLSYNDITRFEYELIDKNGSVIFKTSAQNTDIVFYFDKKMKIYAKDDNDASYTLAFIHGYNASAVINDTISAVSAQFKKCSGDKSLKLQNLYEYEAGGNRSDLGTNWCVFKIPRANGTSFMIRAISSEENSRKVKCIFLEDQFHLRQLPDAKNEFELQISFGQENLGTPYVLKASASKLGKFFESS